MMNPKVKNLLSILIAIVLVLFGGANLLGDTAETAAPASSAAVELAEVPEVDGEVGVLPPEEDEPETEDVTRVQVVESGEYTSKAEVAAYIHQYGHLPSNYITKKAAQKLGWVSSQGNLDKVAPGKSIGGDWFGNYEGILPEVKGREYRECDIDFNGRFRNSKRIIYSNDGLIYYTKDHYKTFTLLYGEE